MPPWRDWTRNGLLHRRVLVRIEPGALPATLRGPDPSLGGLTERKGARLLRDGRGQPRQRSIRCPSAPEGMPRWLGAPCLENSDTALPWGFDTSTFRHGAVVHGATPDLHREIVGSTPPASPSRRHRIMEVRRILNPEAGGQYPVAVLEQAAGLLVVVRSSTAVERVVVTHRRRGFETSLRSPGAVTEDSGTRLQPGPRW